MKYLPFVSTVELRTLDDEPIVTESGHLRISHLDFLIGKLPIAGRLADPEFARGLEGGEIVEVQSEARKNLRDQAAAAEARGFWALENDHAKRIVAATLKPAQPYPGQLAHNFAPFIKAARGILDELPAVMDTQPAASAPS